MNERMERIWQRSTDKVQIVSKVKEKEIVKRKRFNIFDIKTVFFMNESDRSS